MSDGAQVVTVAGETRPDVILMDSRMPELIFAPAIAARLIKCFSTNRSNAFPQLTDREQEVLELIAQGRSNQAIAEHLVLSVKTVRNHVSNIFNKLRVADRAEAIIKAREAGLGLRST